MVDLPSEYVELPYIESDGTNYINTEYVPQNAGTTHIKATIRDYPNANSNKVLFGIKDTSNDTYTSFSVTSGPDSSTTGSVTMNNAGNTLTWSGLINTSTTYEIIWYNDEVYMHNIERGSQSYAGRPGQLFKESTGTYVATTQPIYIFALNNDGVASDMFKGRLYRFTIEVYLTGIVRDYIPCMRKSDKKLGLYDLITGTFLTNEAGNDFTSGFSEAVNASSFARYIVSVCTYTDGSELSTDNKNQLYNYLIEDFRVIGENVALNINTALTVINRLYNIITGSVKDITVSDNTLQSILSVNTARKLVDIYFPVSEGVRAEFTKPSLLYGSSELTADNCSEKKLYSVTDNIFAGTLHGGGGGGGGGLAGDGDKNSNYYGASGKGAAGGKSTISLLNTETLDFDIKAEAAGGAAGGNRTLGNTGGDPGSVERPGNAGGAGATTEVSIEIVRGDTIKISPGYGGGGGGGIGISTNNGSSYSASNGSEAKGGDGKEANSFTGDDQCFGGGGGEGGHGVGYTTTGIGANKESGPNHQSWFDASYQSNGVGGNGGWSNCTDDAGNKANANQPTTIGAGGNGGRGKNWVDEVTHGNGGNGGNAGGFVINSDCDAYEALFIIRR